MKEKEGHNLKYVISILEDHIKKNDRMCKIYYKESCDEKHYPTIREIYELSANEMIKNNKEIRTSIKLLKLSTHEPNTHK